MIMDDRAKVAMLPPLIPLSALAAGLLAHLLFPLEIASGSITMPVGAIAVVASIAIVIAAARELARARTAFDVRKPSTAIVERGVFAFSRNPVYFSMLLLCMGLAFVINSLPMLLLSLPAGSALCLLVIRPEETYLEQKFGSAYLGYKAHVRRWI
jgi:protein-S-isoprenylcysteine O-methyltransferase Ste14